MSGLTGWLRDRIVVGLLVLGACASPTPTAPDVPADPGGTEVQALDEEPGAVTGTSPEPANAAPPTTDPGTEATPADPVDAPPEDAPVPETPEDESAGKEVKAPTPPPGPQPVPIAGGAPHLEGELVCAPCAVGNTNCPCAVVPE
ncbi:MAG: hypothetical protein QGG40_08775 [Myxococcota bacterium]|jgi:outer membrane biosynthesis protein TonB|nr:hypothetical protein [Myxococcota bacterium]